MIKKSICIKNYKCFSNIENKYNIVTGITSEGVIDYYTGQTNSLAYVMHLHVLFTQMVDDIGFYNPDSTEWKENTNYYSGDHILYNDNSYICNISHNSSTGFTYNNWKITPNDDDYSNYQVTITGDSKINEFRRYGKTDNDSDLYNPIWNTGFTQEIHGPNGIVKQITGEIANTDGLSYQKLYNYSIWTDGDLNTKISYSDIGNDLSRISYNSSGLTNENAINMPNIKLDYLIGLVDTPKINVDVFIDRGSNSSFDRHIKLGDVNSLIDFERYGNGYYKIKED